MATILLPIKPKHVNKILNGTKMYEYRKKECKRKVEKIVIYSSSPIKKVVAEVEVLSILKGSPKEIWSLTHKNGGIIEKDFEEYFKNSKEAVAYKLGKVKIYDEPKDLKDLGINFYPQSYLYLD